LVKRIFEHKKEKVMEEWGKITNWETKNSTLQIKKIKWTDYTACVRHMGNAYIIFVEKYEGKGPLDSFAEDRSKVWNALFKKYCVELPSGFMGLKTVASGRCFEHGSERILQSCGTWRHVIC
jgi:hypothetical protein